MQKHDFRDDLNIPNILLEFFHNKKLLSEGDYRMMKAQNAILLKESGSGDPTIYSQKVGKHDFTVPWERFYRVYTDLSD